MSSPPREPKQKDDTTLSRKRRKPNPSDDGGICTPEEQQSTAPPSLSGCCGGGASLQRASAKRPNSTLTESEREEKRMLKKRLRVQSRVKKLERRIAHAVSRKDPIVEKQARDELRHFLEEAKEQDASSASFAEEGEVRTMEVQAAAGVAASAAAVGGDCMLPTATCTRTPDPLVDIRQAVQSICSDLFKHARRIGEEEGYQLSEAAEVKSKDNRDGTSSTSCSSSKVVQTEIAVKLLRSMTKGTQSETMFSPNAIWGYTRQKFYERSVLICTSLCQLRPAAVSPTGSEGLSSEQVQLKERAWTKLLQVKTCCSIGCGPGNDAVGLVLLLRNFGASQPVAVTLLDWMIDAWEGTVIQILRSILASKQLDVEMKSGKCDVTHPFDGKDNREARALINRECHASDDGADKDRKELPETAQPPPALLPCDMYLISYLLSETRGKWDAFCLELVERAAPGSLFYFSEPTPWQLHRLILLCGGSLDFLWLDSSMHYPTLQPLDGRAGPAILLAMKTP